MGRSRPLLLLNAPFFPNSGKFFEILLFEKQGIGEVARKAATVAVVTLRDNSHTALKPCMSDQAPIVRSTWHGELFSK